MTKTKSYEERGQFALEILDKLDAIARNYFRSQNLGVENKEQGGFDPVTLADQEIEICFRNSVEARFPDDAVLGEELPEKTSSNSLQWIIDPIDGTRAFVIGAPCFTTLIALENGGRSVFGVISQAFTQERFVAINGQAYWQQQNTRKPIKVSTCQRLEEAKLASTFPEVGNMKEREAFHNLAPNCKLTRYGLDAYAYALLAAGHIDLVVEAGLKPFDYAAPKAVIEAAGGVFCDWQGAPPQGVSQILAAATPELAQTAIKLLN